MNQANNPVEAQEAQVEAQVELAQWPLSILRHRRADGEATTESRRLHDQNRQFQERA